ncbi:diguanylate cyclase [Oceanibium sediminis]|uniref:diguanylate cyclase n=1 Tax=Oceanibium sediminis TaxID=2026339 RepID=UPI000DD2FCB2|nr:diguanylate cyclase [Oceanibium sediminis]
MTGHIIVIDPVVGNRILLRGRLLSAYYSVEAFDRPESLLEGDRVARADLIFVADGAAARRMLCLLRGDPATAHIPVILTGQRAGPGAPARPVVPLHADDQSPWDAGGDDVLEAPMTDPALFARLKMLIALKRLEDDVRAVDPAFADLPPFPERTDAESRRQGQVVLLFDPGAEPGTLVTQDCLSGLKGRSCIQVDVEDQVQPRVLDCPDTAVILWIHDAGQAGAGLRVLAQLRADPLTRLTPIIAMVPAGDTRLGAQAMELGACDAITADQPADVLANRLRAAERRMARAATLRAALVGGMRLALTDPMTGLHNRRHVLAAGPQLMRRSLRAGKSFAVIMLDIDHFKTVNDTHGHSGGDHVLKVAARRIKQAVRPNDIVSRFGGEEFLIALPDTTGPDAIHVAERVRRAMAERPISLGGKRGPVPLTISAGVAEVSGPEEAACFDELVERADSALYGCKGEGRNRVHLASAPLNGAPVPGSAAFPTQRPA